VGGRDCHVDVSCWQLRLGCGYDKPFKAISIICIPSPSPNVTYPIVEKQTGPPQYLQLTSISGNTWQNSWQPILLQRLTVPSQEIDNASSF